MQWHCCTISEDVRSMLPGNPIMRREPSWHDLSFWHVDIQSMNVLKSVMQSADIRHRVSRQDRLQHCCMMRISSLETVLTAPCRNSVTGQRKRRTIQCDIKFHIQEECSREKNGCFFVYDGCKEIDKKTKLDKTNYKLICTKETQAKIKYNLIKLCNNIKIIRKPLYFSKNKK